MAKTLFKRPNHLYLVIICLIFFTGGYLHKSWNTNLLSLNYYHDLNEAIISVSSIPAAPLDHQRSSLWNAIGAIREENFQNAFILLRPLIDDDDQYALGIKAWAYTAQGNYQDAILLQKMLSNSKELLRICQLTQELERYNDALTACNAAWEVDPRISTLPLASLLIRQENPSNAEKILLQALEQFKNDTYRPYWLFRLATALEKQGCWSEAIKIHQQGNNEQLQVGEKIKSQAQYYTDLAWAYHMNGQTEEAIKTIEMAIDQPEHDFDLYYVWFRAAQIYETAGLFPQALIAYQYCLELRPDSTTAKDAIERLSDLSHE